MAQTILVAGKDGEKLSQFSQGLNVAKRNVVLTKDEQFLEDDVKLSAAEKKANLADYEVQKEKEAESGSCVLEWNKSSSLSARSLILQSEVLYGSLDEAVLFFDEDYFASTAQKIEASEISRCNDEYILSFEFLAMEILSRFESKKSAENPGTLIFMLKESPCIFDVLKTPSLRNGMKQIASPLIASAASSFSAFAQNIAASFGDKDFVNIILVRYDVDSEFSKEKDLASWLCEYLDSIKEAKSNILAKKAVSWVKPGSKFSTGIFGIFKK